MVRVPVESRSGPPIRCLAAFDVPTGPEVPGLAPCLQTRQSRWNGAVVPARVQLLRTAAANRQVAFVPVAAPPKYRLALNW